MKSFGKFLEIVEGFNLVLVALGKGSCSVSFFGGGRQPWEKGVGRFEIALELFFIFFQRQTLRKGIRRFDIALGLFFKIF